MSDQSQENPKKPTLKRVLGAAYAYVRGAEMNKASAPLTFDHLIQQQKKALKSDNSGTVVSGEGETVRRPSRWDMLDRLEKDIDSVVKQVNDAGDDPAKLSAIGLTTQTKNTEG